MNGRTAKKLRELARKTTVGLPAAELSPVGPGHTVMSVQGSEVKHPGTLMHGRTERSCYKVLKRASRGVR